MKYNLTCKFMGTFYHHCAKENLINKGVTKEKLKAVKKEYKEICLRAKDIGKAQLLTSYLMGAYFIAMNRSTGLSKQENIDCLMDGCIDNKIFRKAMGTADNYFDPERTEKRKEWSKKSKLREYENDWVLDVLDKTDDYELGYNYYECGVCKLFKDEGCFEDAKYMCATDFKMADMMNLKLERTQTLAEGGEFCDFRYSHKDYKK